MRRFRYSRVRGWRRADCCSGHAPGLLHLSSSCVRDGSVCCHSAGGRLQGRRVVTSMGKPRVLLADDHTLVVEAFAKLLEPQFEIVGTAGDGRAVLEKSVQLQPDVILLDLSMPILNGFEAGERLKKIGRAHV